MSNTPSSLSRSASPAATLLSSASSSASGLDSRPSSACPSSTGSSLADDDDDDDDDDNNNNNDRKSTKSEPSARPTRASSSDAPPEGREKRKRSRVTPEQLQHLERYFANDRSPTAARRKEISDLLGMNERQTQIWFQNRRAKAKLHEGKSKPRIALEDPLPDPAADLSVDNEVYKLIHEDRPVTIFPCSQLSVGSWRRIATVASRHDLVTYVCEAKRCLMWFIHSGGHGFKMEIPFATIVGIALTHLPSGAAVATLRLANPPHFYLEHAAAASRLWRRCADWTEGMQATKVLHHELVGAARQLDHILRYLGSNTPAHGVRVSLASPGAADLHPIDCSPAGNLMGPPMGPSLEDSLQTPRASLSGGRPILATRAMSDSQMPDLGHALDHNSSLHSGIDGTQSLSRPSSSPLPLQPYSTDWELPHAQPQGNSPTLLLHGSPDASLLYDSPQYDYPEPPSSASGSQSSYDTPSPPLLEQPFVPLSLSHPWDTPTRPDGTPYYALYGNEHNECAPAIDMQELTGSRDEPFPATFSYMAPGQMLYSAESVV